MVFSSLFIFCDVWSFRCLYKELLSIHERDPHYDPYLNSQVGIVIILKRAFDIQTKFSEVFVNMHFWLVNVHLFDWKSGMSVQFCGFFSHRLFFPVEGRFGHLPNARCSVTPKMALVMSILILVVMTEMARLIIVILKYVMSYRYSGFKTRHSDLLQGWSLHTSQVVVSSDWWVGDENPHNVLEYLDRSTQLIWSSW